MGRRVKVWVGDWAGIGKRIMLIRAVCARRRHRFGWWRWRGDIVSGIWMKERVVNVSACCTGLPHTKVGASFVFAFG